MKNKLDIILCTFFCIPVVIAGILIWSASWIAGVIYFITMIVVLTAAVQTANHNAKIDEANWNRYSKPYKTRK